MKREKLLFIFIITFIFLTASSFQIFKGDIKRKLKNHQSQQRIKKVTIKQKRIRKIKSINQGKPLLFQEPRYAPDKVIVKFRSSLSVQKINNMVAAYQSEIVKINPRLNRYKLKIPENTTVEEMLFVLSKNPDVEYVVPNYIPHIATTPNDLYFKYQYALYNSGQKIGDDPEDPQGKPRADIKATEAWEETNGIEDKIIAVLDSGVDMLHPDLENKIYSTGRDFINDDFDATDDNGHGTHVAGIAAANTNNNIGIAGVAWNCKILPVKVVDENGEAGDYDPLIEGIQWAVDNGAHVINISLGGDGHDPDLEEAVKYAYENNVVVVAAAGNYDPVWGSDVIYPAAYDSYCLAVAASDYNDENPLWSNFGSEVDVSAPGDRILSLWPLDLTEEGYLPYAWWAGTSMSTPHVAGLAALIISIKPWLEVWEIMDIIRYSADDVNSSQYSGKDEFIGYGRINMEKALVPLIISSSRKR